jgi:hypothetical protein
MDKVKMMWEHLTPYKIAHLSEYFSLTVDKKDVEMVDHFMVVLNLMQRYEIKWFPTYTGCDLRCSTFVFSTKEKEMLETIKSLAGDKKEE